MDLAMRWAMLVMLAGCFPRPSDALVCAVSTDCEDGRSCESGFCVGADAAVMPDQALPIDAPASPPDTLPDAPPRPCTGGEANATDAGGSCYVAFRTAAVRKTRANAQAACVALDMQLAIVDTASENATVQSLIPGLDAWLGATDAVTEGTFLWPDTTPLSFTNFRLGEPNNGAGNGQEDCLVIEGARGGSWDDRPCGLVLAYVCFFAP
jgi:hypothetical protein